MNKAWIILGIIAMVFSALTAVMGIMIYFWGGELFVAMIFIFIGMVIIAAMSIFIAIFSKDKK